MRKIIFIVILMIFFPSLPAYAEDICFTPLDANIIYRDLSEKKVLDEENKALQNANDLLKQNIDLEERRNTLLQERITLQDQLIKNSEQLLKEQAGACEKIVDSAKPTLWDTVKTTGVGVVIGAILMLLL